MNTLTNLHVYKESNTPYWVAAFLVGKLSEQDIDHLTWWCYRAFGPGLGNFRLDSSPFVYRWINDIEWGEVRFSREDDLNWFVLKWS